jgi:hypothetical protein
MKNFTSTVIRDAELVEISNAVDTGLYDGGLWCSRSCDLRHMRRRSTAAAVQRGGPFGKFVSLGSRKTYAVFVGKESVHVLLATV